MNRSWIHFDTLGADMTLYPDAYIAYLVEFHATRDYFECHELLEEYWKENPEDGLGEAWVGLIQLAVGQYHERRGNRRGAAMMYSQAESRLGGADLSGFGLDGPSLLNQISQRKLAAEAGESDYEDIQIRIVDSKLLDQCLELCGQRSLIWGAASPMHLESIIHRHKLRDRSDVIAARAEALREKGERNDR
ncbi:DUF309 domain-containing protein [Paenibacillus sp. GCM10027627]|uniref:DUF309 domain-containing protein n=1 Tax=unclassified Paenibacillus TaxID=185978 RepID=UPI00363BE60C